MDFVTYHHAEFIIGPSLNMIIGPNGTGKSTVVCAICLGLGGRPEILGRAKMPSDFIRHGATSASIIIELQGHLNKPNITIKRTIEAKNSTWYLNRRLCIYKEIKKVTDDFRIQMDNLCQFLPQDKVSKFAELPSNELLLETERAVGSQNLVRCHEKLVELDEQQSAVSSKLEDNKKRLKDLETRQAEDGEKISRMKERQRYKAQYDLFVKARPFLKYREMTVLKKELENEKRAKVAELHDLESQRKTLDDLTNTVSERTLEKKKQVRITKESIGKLALKIEERKEKVRSAVESLQDDQAKLYTLETRKKSQEESKVKLQQKISSLEKFFQSYPTPDHQDLVRLQESARQLREEIQRNQDEADQSRQDMEQIEEKGHILRSNLRSHNDKLNRLNSVLSQKLDYLSRNESKLGGDTAKAAEFILRNKNLFEREVHLPPVISVKFKDQRCLPQISANINRNNMFTFTCESRKDYQTFTKIIIDEKNWNVNVAEYEATRKTRVEDHVVPCERNKLSELGLDGFIIDLLEGPMPVLNMLCHKSNIQAMPYAAGLINKRQKQQLINAKDQTGEPLFRRFVDSKTLGVVIKSRYGARLTSCRENMLAQPPGYMSSSSNSSSDEVIKRVKVQIQQIEREINVVDDQLSLARSAYGEIESEVTAAKNKLQENNHRQREFKEMSHKYDRYKVIQESTEQELAELVTSGAKYEEDIKKADANIEKHFNNITLSTGKLIEATQSLVAKQKEYQKRMIETMACENEVNIYGKLGTELMNGKEKEMAQINEKVEKLHQQMREMKQEVKKVRETCSVEEKNGIEALYNNVEYTLDILDRETSKVKATLELSQTGGEEATLARYTKQARDIEELSRIVSEAGTASEQYLSEITRLRAAWEPELHSIVSRVSHEFSNAFKLIKCRGEVKLGNTDKGFKDWTMDIMVSFRDNTDLQTLTHQRQSGGERSVSTIFYLISLQGLTKSPFRVVDEINQGMDQKNERIVHSRMVDVACRDNSSQYFLITPKLLTDLEYHEKMKVHCIYSGSFVKDISEVKFSPCYLKNLVKIARQLQAEEAEGDEEGEDEEE